MNSGKKFGAFTEKQQKKIDQIIEVSVKIFRKEGYKATTMRAIAAKLAMNQGSLYYYFKSKADILVEIHRRMMEMVLDQQKEFENSHLSNEQKLERVIEKILFIQHNYRDYSHVFLKEFSSLPLPYQKKVRAVANEYRIMLENIFDDGIKKKQFKKLNPTITCLALLGMCNWVVFWYRKNGPIPLNKIGEIFSEIFFDGVRAHHQAKVVV